MFTGKGESGKGFRTVGIVTWDAAWGGQGAWCSEAAEHTWNEFAFSHRAGNAMNSQEL